MSLSPSLSNQVNVPAFPSSPQRHRTLNFIVAADRQSLPGHFPQILHTAPLRTRSPTHLLGRTRLHETTTMAQGGLKSSSRPAPTGKPKQKQVKNASRVAKPQKAKHGLAADKMQKKFAAGLVNKTEKLLGERAGHLELIGKGKKAKKEEKGLAKGGSRKYG
ncbi:hypothetical protein CTRI78_v003100 [Colletotrichum trifolii]|uniref:Uncharacterized protein n=2 Tax=Colletotrichum orbiculare species complex TaxID=2707354 RepID=A0A4R8RK78_COLTR|nr:hypothetical protein CTRI78_v003100 [Colletotrichum trifolii]